MSGELIFLFSCFVIITKLSDLLSSSILLIFHSDDSNEDDDDDEDEDEEEAEEEEDEDESDINMSSLPSPIPPFLVERCMSQLLELLPLK